jgi:REase_DpnII-MboI
MISLLERYNDELERILDRFHKDRDGIHIDQSDDVRFRQMTLELRDLFDDAFADGRRHSQVLIEYFNDSISNYVGSPSLRGVENVKGVVASALARVKRNPLALKTAALEAKARGEKDPEVLTTLADRLHGVVHQLRERREGRPTLDVQDAYDVQDLFYALLKIYFEDIRKKRRMDADLRRWSLTVVM